jgi:hypothetical protein
MTAPPLPAPSDSALHTAWERYRDGRWRIAALLTHERLHAATLSHDDSLEARVQLAFALLAMGDTVSANAAIAEVMHDAPCLTLSSVAPPEFEARFDRARQPARCDVSAGRTMALGLLFPGLGQLSRGRSIGYVLGAGAVAALGFAAIRYTSSRPYYRSYQSTTNTQTALSLYEKASRRRHAARQAAWTGIGIWALGAVEAGIHEMRHGAEVRRVRGYGATPMVRSDAGRTDLGLALSF